jgi:hypothetical protein
LCSPIGGSISTENFRDDEKLYAKAARWIPIDGVKDVKFYNPVDSPGIIVKAFQFLQHQSEA